MTLAFNSPFLPAYQHITQPDFNPTGLWLLHGDEPLLAIWLSDVFKQVWHKQQTDVERIELKSAKDWGNALAQLNTLSLFASNTAVILTGNHKPDKSTQQQVVDFAMQDNGNCLLVVMPKQDNRSLKNAFFQVVAQHGKLIQTSMGNEQERERILQYKAQQFGLQLDNRAWAFLLEHTQHNLLVAYQSLWRLADLLNTSASNPHGEQATVATLQPALVSQSNYSLFDLTDAALAGKVALVVKIMQQLQQAQEPESLVLWALTKAMRTVKQLVAGQDINNLGIWRSKQGLYRQAASRQNTASVADWTGLLYQADCAIKGLTAQPAWEVLWQLALKLAGVSLWQHSF